MRRSGLRPSLLFSLFAATLVVGACLNPIMDPPLSYVLRFDGNGSTAGDLGAEASYELEPAFAVVQVGTSVVVPGRGTLESGTQGFRGWSTRPGGGAAVYRPGAVVPMPAHDVTLYAVWTSEPTFSVAYSTNSATSGSAPVDSIGHFPGEAVTVLPNSGGLVRTGYTFGGWNTTSAGDGDDRPPGTTFTMPATNLTLHAKWVPDGSTFTVTFDSQGADTPASPTSIDVFPPATTVGSLPTEPTLAGQFFGGWWTEPGGGGTEFTATTTVAGNITVYAFWSAVPPYTVTFESNGGSIVSAQTVPEGGLVTEPADPVRAGHTFGGWYADAGLTTPWNFAADTVTADVTLYAQWTANSYEIIYNANGGTGTMANQPVTFGQTVTLIGSTFTRDNHRQPGWSDTPGGGIIWFDGAGYTHDIEADRTLYAVWAEEFTVTYTSGGADGGTPPVDPNTYVEDDPVIVLGNSGDPALFLDGFTFGGWTDGVTDFVAGNDFPMPPFNVVLNPTWVPNTYAVNFDPDGGTGIMPSVAVDYEEWIVLPPSTFSRVGYSFNGWAVVPSGPIIYVDEANYQHVTVGDQTLYALWTLDPEFAGGDGSAGNPYQVATATHLDNVRNHLGVEFLQTDNIDIGVSPWNEGAGWEPIGTDVTPFIGVYDGGGLTISGLTINRSENNVGLFGQVAGATIERVHLEGVSVFGLINTGALVGSSALTPPSFVRESYATGTVDSDSYHVGGLIGFAGEMTIERTFSAVAVESTLNAANLRIGGLVGMSNIATINDSYAIGTVTATGAQGFIGGLLGGGTGTSINRSYAAGRVTTGGATAGGLVGDGAGVNVTDAFYDTYTTGMTDTGNGIPRQTAEMLQQAGFAGWQFVPTPSAPWTINPDTSYPYLEWYTGPTPVPATAFALRDVGPAGGWIFYDKGSYVDGWRYLEAAPADASAGIVWGGSGTLVDLTSQDVGTGQGNTNQIIGVLGFATTYAAGLASSQTTAGFTDWFLPSAGELQLMYQNLHVETVGGFDPEGFYWASSEADATYAYGRDFGSGTPYSIGKTNSLHVRHARRF